MDLNYKNIRIRGKDAQYLQLNNEGIKAVFYSANGFPLGTYSEFLKHLTPKFNLSCLSPRACWPNIGAPALQTNWEIYADDLIAFIEQMYSEPIVVIGHSQGATAAIIAASKRPELFKSLILIEPASVSKILGFVVKHMPFSIKKHFQPFKSGLLKQDIWETREAFYNDCRQNKAYKRIGDVVLKDFVEFGLKPIENEKFTLTFSSKWETSNYALAPYIWKYLNKINLPIHIIAGKPSLFFSPNLRVKWKKSFPNLSLEENGNFGHLFPLESPTDCANRILNKF